MEPKAFIFDLDGTLVDSLGDIAEVVNLTRDFYALKRLEKEVIRRSIGKGVENLIKGCFSELPQAKVPEILKKHRELYLKHPHVDGSLYPHVRSVLDAIRKSKLKVGIATNKPKQVAVLTLEHYLPDFHFDVVMGPEDVSKKKPAAEHLLETLKAIQVKPQEAYFCGDDPVDLQCAEASGVRFLAAGWGFGGVKGNDSQHLMEFSEILRFVPQN